jgi:hypothetical protein
MTIIKLNDSQEVLMMFLKKHFKNPTENQYLEICYSGWRVPKFYFTIGEEEVELFARQFFEQLDECILKFKHNCLASMHNGDVFIKMFKDLDFKLKFRHKVKLFFINFLNMFDFTPSYKNHESKIVKYLKGQLPKYYTTCETISNLSRIYLL